MSVDIPIVVTAAGLTPALPSDLRSRLVAESVALNPGVTTDLPGTLIEDLASTGVGALTVTDSALVELVNSITPYGANLFILNQLGQIYGVQQGIGANGSVYLQFSGPAGFLIAKGFLCTDGTYQYTVQDGGIIDSDGQSALLFAVAVQAGTFTIPANSVTQLATSVPTGITLTVTNPTAGVPATAAQKEQDYRAQVLQAGVAEAQGVPSFLKTQLQKVAGVQTRLISVQQASPGFRILVGGGDPYKVANAIYTGIGDISTLQGSTLEIAAITNANPGVVTTNIPHGFTSGMTNVEFQGVTGTVGVNGVFFTIMVLSPVSFSIGIDTTSLGAYTGGGTVTPNLRNVVVSINDYPDTYLIPFIVPLQESLTIGLLYGTISANIVSNSAISQLATPAIVDYVNGIAAGQPLNVFELQAVFQQAVSSILATPLISRMVFSVAINGVTVTPEAGTGIIPGDPLSYFFITSAGVTVAAG